MPLKISKPYEYGDDIDGNRGIMVHDYIVISDVSGKVIEGDVYDLDYNFYASKEEAFNSVFDKLQFTSGTVILADGSEANLEEEEIYQCNINGEFYALDMAEDYLDDHYRKDVDNLPWDMVDEFEERF